MLRVLFIGDDWAEDHHDIEIEDADGRRLARARLPEGLEGITRLHALVAEHAPAAWAELLPEQVWRTLERPAPYEVATTPRQRPLKVKEEVVRRKGYKNIRLVSEHVAEFDYRPGACKKDYRVVVLREGVETFDGPAGHIVMRIDQQRGLVDPHHLGIGYSLGLRA